MPGMALKPRTKSTRIAPIAAWASFLLVGFLELLLRAQKGRSLQFKAVPRLFA